MIPWGVVDYTDLLVKFFNLLNIQNPILMGHSFGGRVSIQYASSYPVKKMVLIDSAGIKPKHSPQYYVKIYTYKTIKNILRLPLINKYSDEVLKFFKSKLGSSDYKNVSGVMQKTLVKVVNEDLRNILALIKAPTLLIWGENDQATPVADGKIMEKLIPGAGLVVLKHAGHFSYLDKAEEFKIIVKSFLEYDKGAAHD
jgi:pimeloyl-ACP methyl ester carboxylesterase